MEREQRLAETFVELADTLQTTSTSLTSFNFLAARCVELLGVGAAGMLLADQDGSLRNRGGLR